MQDSTSVGNSTAFELSRSVPWWAKVIAIAALLNLVLVLFNLSYIPLRDIYLRHLPGIVTTVDPLKGIEPHPFTQKYLHTVDELEQQLPQVGLQAPITQQLLANLRQQSVALIDENPFLAAMKFGTFANIQRQMRQHLATDSAKQAFERFWSSDFLTLENWQQQIQFFDRQIRPLIQTNYFRYVDDYGHYIDKFWQLDLLFMGFFALEFLVHTFLISYRQPSLSWFDAMLRRWYDIFLFLPFWRWLRIMPVIARLHQTSVLNLERVLAQITHEPAAYLSDKASKFLIVRLINQLQESIVGGDIARALLNPKPSVKVNEIDEVDAITDRLLRLTIYKVLPKIQPNLEAIAHYSIEGAFKQSDFYQSLQNIPGIANLPSDVTEQLANSLAQACVDVAASSYADEKGRKIFDRLTTDFSAALRLELQNKEVLQQVQALLADWLEEVKLNYVANSKARNPEATMAEVEQLLQTTEQSSAAKSVSLEVDPDSLPISLQE